MAGPIGRIGSTLGGLTILRTACLLASPLTISRDGQ